ncbi:hypothetical protein LOC67_24475 [Stieleria sp. JC731]|nr:hypothetical protein [Stieleria sp. JC731]MCC9603718.1 hypothetical protein [Stieleria sp. JC731]
MRVFVVGVFLLSLLSFVLSLSIPRVKNGIQFVPTPGSGRLSGYSGVRTYGWPVATTTEQFWVRSPFGVLHSPLEHAFGDIRIEVGESHRSKAAIVINAAFFVAAFVFLSIASQVVIKGRLSLRALMASVTCVAVMIAVFTYAKSLPAPKANVWMSTAF